MPGREPIIMLRGERVGLGPLRNDLVDTYQRWFNDMRVLRTLAAPNFPMTREAEQQWADNALVDRTSAVFTVYELVTALPIGNAGLEGIDWQNRSANYGIVIGEPDTWNRGYGTEVTELVLNYAFDVLGLYNVMLEAFETNPGGLTAYERAGFKRIGVRRGAVMIGRQRRDVILMDATADDIGPSRWNTLIQEGRWQ